MAGSWLYFNNVIFRYFYIYFYIAILLYFYISIVSIFQQCSIALFVEQVVGSPQDISLKFLPGLVLDVTLCFYFDTKLHFRPAAIVGETAKINELSRLRYK